MSNKLLSNAQIFRFCESMAVMYSAGIQLDEASHMIGENMGNPRFRATCTSIYSHLANGSTLTSAMTETGGFPPYALSMIEIGEQSGRLESVLRGLAKYYDESARLFARIKGAVAYPAALLCIMSVILLVTVTVILPVFLNVYQNFTGDLAASSYSYVNVALIIGYVALVVTLLLTLIALVSLIMCSTIHGQRAMIAVLSHIPGVKGPFYQLEISKFTNALACSLEAGLDSEAAISHAMQVTNNSKLRLVAQNIYENVTDQDKSLGLAGAVAESGIYGPIYSHMLIVGSRTGSVGSVLDAMGTSLFDEAVVRIDRQINAIEPILAAFMTIAVGCALIAVMIPLIAIMGSIG